MPNDASEEGAYILGTHRDELFRLGVQHQVWAEEAQRGFRIAKINAGHVVLDLGCGPGFVSKELAFCVGQQGRVIGVDRSATYLAHLRATAALHALPIETRERDFTDLQLIPSSLDAMFCRWALAWIDSPDTVLEHVRDALKPGGVMVMHEYFDWGTHQVLPGGDRSAVAIRHAIAACLKSFKAPPGDIDVGRALPQMVSKLGMELVSARLMPKLVRPRDAAWQWPASFYRVYFPALVDLGYLTRDQVEACLRELDEVENQPDSLICCPLMIEVIARKPA